MAEKPKRPLSAYMLWLSSAREQIKKDNPGIKMTEIAKKGGELWRAMKDKSEWENKAVKQKDEYTKLVQEFERNGGSKDAGRKKSKGARKAAPKKSRNKDSDDDDEESGEESD
ncbi:mobility group protein 1A-like [Malaya genurostris]|uniref:mobility group protein 1A-like n=1 Tax=Malaya genurostris TaxID=325434 RepID=UPI0026F3E85E|nr:mobility group protein 1A-like [Malaya genurostris]XP_058455395.1 mobility group protein 1A-like [Malaya genurostris]XP_058455396.1 mobility group protein 1A-like [Malaya genurostris]XP_058455398.1 mobility group protein 1A-like [Malaya genurostris]